MEKTADATEASGRGIVQARHSHRRRLISTRPRGSCHCDGRSCACASPAITPRVAARRANSVSRIGVEYHLGGTNLQAEVSGVHLQRSSRPRRLVWNRLHYNTIT
eukprot:scaffold4604_cov128-Isochrysis_galbana.AAC.1